MSEGLRDPHAGEGQKPCFSLEKEPVLHRGCGGRVWHNSINQRWACYRCPLYWRDSYVKNMQPEDINARFYLEYEPDAGTFVLIEEESGGKKVTLLIPASQFDEAKHKKVKLP